mgnify:CR=1 FL=1
MFRLRGTRPAIENRASRSFRRSSAYADDAAFTAVDDRPTALWRDFESPAERPAAPMAGVSGAAALDLSVQQFYNACWQHCWQHGLSPATV